ncbi:MAG: nucleotidyltransferase family protein [Pirellulaceae bacterium]
MSDLKPSLLLRFDRTVRDAMTTIGEGQLGIVLLIDDSSKFLTTITDGDIRRAILRGVNVDASVMQVVEEGRPRSASVTAGVHTSLEERWRIMEVAQVKHLPILNDCGQVVDLLLHDDPMHNEFLPVEAMIMAGGFGTRLRPLTEDIPKPMLPIDGQPLLERTVNQLRKAGICNINVSTHYKSDKITQYFGTGRKFGVNMKYLAEEQPLGTAGALGLIENIDKPLLVVNGDILTMVDFRSMFRFHCEQHADLTVGVRQYTVDVPYGVIRAEEGVVSQIQEKPKLEFLVNAGVYLVEPSVLGEIPTDERFDMTDLIEKLLLQDRPIVSFPIVEYWLDIGRMADFERAQEDIKNMRQAA